MFAAYVTTILISYFFFFSDVDNLIRPERSDETFLLGAVILFCHCFIVGSVFAILFRREGDWATKVSWGRVGNKGSSSLICSNTLGHFDSKKQH